MAIKINLTGLFVILFLVGCTFYGRDFSLTQVKSIQADVSLYVVFNKDDTVRSYSFTSN